MITIPLELVSNMLFCIGNSLYTSGVKDLDLLMIISEIAKSWGLLNKESEMYELSITSMTKGYYDMKNYLESRNLLN